MIIRGEIAFDRVSFSYQQDRDILRDVTFTLGPHSRVLMHQGSAGIGGFITPPWAAEGEQEPEADLLPAARAAGDNCWNDQID